MIEKSLVQFPSLVDQSYICKAIGQDPYHPPSPNMPQECQINGWLYTQTPSLALNFLCVAICPKREQDEISELKHSNVPVLPKGE